MKNHYAKDSLTLGGTVAMGTGAAALLMVLSMIINESLVARTFGTYTLQLFDVRDTEQWAPFLAIGLIIVAY